MYKLKVQTSIELTVKVCYLTPTSFCFIMFFFSKMSSSASVVCDFLFFFFYSVERQWACSHFIDEATEALPHFFLDGTANLRMRAMCSERAWVPGDFLDWFSQLWVATSGFVLQERNNQLLGLVTLAAFLSHAAKHTPNCYSCVLP